MTRTLAFLAAVLLTTLTVTTSCLANSPEDLRFALRPSTGRGGDVTLQIRSGRDDRHNGMTSSFQTAELTGLDRSRLFSGGSIQFALVREAGRVDCAGNARNQKAEGRCRFTADQSFSDFLGANGMQRPNLEQSYDMMLVGVHRDLVSALRAANYPMPSIDDYIALSAVGVTRTYISELSRAGYRPKDIDDLVEFRAVGVTPKFLGAMARAGYSNLPSEKVVQLAALDIDPEFIRGFERIGYRNLPVETLVELKALDVTPDFVLMVRNSMMKNASLHQVVKLKAIGFSANQIRR
jgi:hypothetical protein